MLGFLGETTGLELEWAEGFVCQARIVEIRQEVERLLNNCTETHKADSIPRLLQDPRPG